MSTLLPSSLTAIQDVAMDNDAFARSVFYILFFCILVITYCNISNALTDFLMIDYSKLTTFSYLKDTSNNQSCTIFSIIYTIKNAMIGAGTLLIYKLSLVNRLGNICGVQQS